MPLVCLQSVIVVLPDHTHLLFLLRCIFKVIFYFSSGVRFLSVVRNHEECNMRNILLSILLVFQEEISFIVFLCLNLALYLFQARIQWVAPGHVLSQFTR